MLMSKRNWCGCCGRIKVRDRVAEERRFLSTVEDAPKTLSQRAKSTLVVSRVHQETAPAERWNLRLNERCFMMGIPGEGNRNDLSSLEASLFH